VGGEGVWDEAAFDATQLYQGDSSNAGRVIQSDLYLYFPAMLISFQGRIYLSKSFQIFFIYPTTLLNKHQNQVTSSQCRGQKNANLYIHAPIRLHGIVKHRNKFIFLPSNL
jgi:hypothetical protein